MTTEPKFVPKEAAEIQLAKDVSVLVRLIDCVGYMVEGAAGHMENGAERLVKTPWNEKEIPFTKAAEIGTKKVIHDHSTIGIVVTTDGSIGELPRNSYRAAEKKTIQELKSIGKPFVVLVNTRKPYSAEAKNVAEEIQKDKVKEMNLTKVGDISTSDTTAPMDARKELSKKADEMGGKYYVVTSANKDQKDIRATAEVFK